MKNTKKKEDPMNKTSMELLTKWEDRRSITEYSYDSSLRIFPIGSKLLDYLSMNSIDIQKDKRSYRLSTILLAIFEVIRDKEQFDPLDPLIIVCEPELEEALEVRTLEINQMVGYLEKKLIKIRGRMNYSKSDRIKEELEAMSFFYNKPVEEKREPFETEEEYYVKPKLQKVLKKAPHALIKSDRILRYRHVCELVSSYIMHRKHDIVDLRNIRVLDLRNDLLGQAFEVNYLTRNQVTGKIRDQLIRIRRSPRKKIPWVIQKYLDERQKWIAGNSVER